MTLVGLVLGCLGVVDLVRWQDERLGRRAVAGLAAGGGYAVLVLALGGVGVAATAAIVVLLVLASTVWVVTSSRCLREDSLTWPALAAATTILVGSLAVSARSPSVGGPLDRWYSGLPLDVLSGLPLDRFLVVLGCALLLTSTGNVLVRLVLTAAGSRVTRSEQQIKGGRVLGPMERLLIFGLGLAGNLAAASVIVAAKGLLRFPELQSYRASGPVEAAEEVQRIDVLTEYFLIGSMTSWLLALACLVLV